MPFCLVYNAKYTMQMSKNTVDVGFSWSLLASGIFDASTQLYLMQAHNALSSNFGIRGCHWWREAQQRGIQCMPYNANADQDMQLTEGSASCDLLIFCISVSHTQLSAVFYLIQCQLVLVLNWKRYIANKVFESMYIAHAKKKEAQRGSRVSNSTFSLPALQRVHANVTL